MTTANQPESKHTPGPWKLGGVCDRGEWDSRFIDVPGHDQAIRVSTVGPGVKPDYGCQLADALLICAAPDLLEACKRLLAAHAPICEGDDSGEDDDCKFARAAISKATGGAA